MSFHISFTLDEHQDLVLKQALRKVFSFHFPSISLSLCCGKTPFEITADCGDAKSNDEKHFAFVSSLFKMIFQFYSGFN